MTYNVFGGTLSLTQFFRGDNSPPPPAHTSGRQCLPDPWLLVMSCIHSRLLCVSGVCMWEIMSYGVKPFPELQNNQVIDVVERGERLSRPSSCPLAVYTLMCACWMYRPSDRPNFAFIKARLRSALSRFFYLYIWYALCRRVIAKI